MIKINELRVGDIVRAHFDEQLFEGTVEELNHEDKEICVISGDQESWYSPEDISAVPLDDNQLRKLNFEKIVGDDGSIKYLRGPFRILLSAKDRFDQFDIWYREDRRHISHHLGVHELQNHYHQMTKVDLTEA